MRLLVRTDAGTAIGTGHAMRCLALVQAWQQAGAEAIIAAAEMPDKLEGLLQAEGARVVRLHTQAGSPADAAALCSLAHSMGSPWIVVDGYHFGGPYQKAVKDAGQRLLVIDDHVHADHYWADLILNQNLHAHESLYAERERHTKLLLGPRFALLRREFQAWPDRARPTAERAGNILVTLGGSDPKNATGKVIDALRQLKGAFQAVVLVGAASQHGPALAEAVRGWEASIQIKPSLSDMPSLLAWADCAVSAGGTTCWELAFMGVPHLTIVLADNQVQVADELARLGTSVNLGEEAGLTPARIAEALEGIMSDSTWRAQARRKGQCLSDGMGAERVCTILNRGEAAAQLRPAEPDDAFSLWRMANDPETRKNSFSPAPIPLQQHLDWFEAKLRSPAFRMWVYEADGAICAEIRYEHREPGIAEIGFSVAPAARNQGWGKKILTATHTLACRELGVHRVRGVVFESNIPSQRAFLGAGFEEAERTIIRRQPCCVFEREIDERAAGFIPAGADTAGVNRVNPAAH